MNSASFDRAQDFIWKNARLLERFVFANQLGGGPVQPALAALKAYQNPDGGFGNALEPDKRCPDSQPVDVERALMLLDQLGVLGDNLVCRDLVLPACEFLTSIATLEGGVPFALPSVNRYPHAPWWGTPDTPPADLNPTAGIVGLLLKYRISHPWVEQAAAYCWPAIEASETDQFHTLMPVITFLQHAPDRERAQRALDRIAARLRRPGVVEMDPAAGGYVQMPLDWAPTPDAFCHRLFDDATLARHLDALEARQRPDGGWPISWDPISPAVELEWRGIRTLDALTTLRAYGRFPTELDLGIG